jgi:GTPase SAR1 family protein
MWLEDAMEVALENLTTILIGNKCDLSDRRAVSYEEGESFAKTHGLFFMESSAKIAHNVDEVMFYPWCSWYNCTVCPSWELKKKRIP